MLSTSSRTPTPRVLRGKAIEQLCTFCGRDEKPVSPGELCPVEGAVLDNAGEKLEPMEVTEETGTRVPVKAADPKLPTPE